MNGLRNGFSLSAGSTNRQHCVIKVEDGSHFVAVGQALEDVKEFGVYADDLIIICEHLKTHNNKAVAIESTGTYWELLKQDFDVTL